MSVAPMSVAPLNAGLAVTAAPYVLELYETLRELDPARFRREMAERIQARLVQLSHELERISSGSGAQSVSGGARGPGVALQGASSADSAGIQFGLELQPEQAELELRSRLRDLVAALREVSGSKSGEGWAEFRQRMHPSYEAAARVLRLHAVHVPSLRPTNISRSIFHVGSALVALACVALLPEWTPWIASAFFSSAFVMEVLRRFSPEANRALMGVFKRVAHPHEAHRINSASWYSAALVVLAFAFEPLFAAIAVTVLGLADPLAALVGRRFGRIRLVHGRSLEGTLTFIAVGTLSAWCVLSLFYPGQIEQRWSVAFAAAFGGGLAELFSKRLDDNFTVPVSTALAAWLITQA